MANLAKVLREIPKVVSLELTTRCNLDCVYCTKKSKQIGDVDLDFLKVQELKEKFTGIDRVIVCGIGESFCYPHIYEFVHLMADKKISIVTNGTIPIDYQKLNEHRNIEMLIYSIDAIKQETLNKVSGRYSLNNLIKNLREYSAYQAQTKRNITRVLNCTLNEHNLGELLELVDFARDYKFSTVHFSLPRGGEDFICENRETLEDILRRAGRKARENGIFFVDPFETCCVYLNWVTPYVSINGDVFACAETLYLDEKLGSLHEMSLAEIWQTPAYQEFQTGRACEKCKFLSNCKFKFK